MAINLIINGISYSYPETGDEDWGDEATNWAVAVSNSTLQKVGGLFTLTSDVDFGATAGVLSKFYSSRDPNPADAGVLRLTTADTIQWRNTANTGNNTLGHTNNILEWNGIDLVDVSSVQSLTNKTISGATPTEISYVQGATSNLQGQIDVLIAEPDAIWGGIIGTLSDQTDLQAALDTKITETSTSTLTNKTMNDISNDIHANQVHLAVRNVSGVTMNVGQAVKFVGYNTGLDVVEVTLADQSTDIAIGLIETILLNNENGEVTVSGIQEGINTIAFAEGEILFVNGAGALTNVRPVTGFMQPVAFVLYSHGTQGIIQVLVAHPLQDADDIRYSGTLTATDVRAALDELDAQPDAIWGGIIGTLSDQTDLQTELDKAVWLDGSRVMTGGLEIGDGTSGRTLIIKESGGDQSFRFRNTANIFTTSFVEDNTADEFLIIKHDPVTNADLTIVTLYTDGNMGIAGGANTPTDGSHLVRLSYFESETANFVTNPMTSNLDTDGWIIKTVDKSTVGAAKRILLYGGAQSFVGGGMDSGHVLITGGDGTNSNNGGRIDIFSGDADGATGVAGDINITAGRGTNGSNAGDINITAGLTATGTTGVTGNVTIKGGAGAGTTDAGNVHISGGDGLAGNLGGAVIIEPGAAAGSNGAIEIHSPAGNTLNAELELYKDTNGAHTTGPKVTFGVPQTLVTDAQFYLPIDNGTANYILQTDGAGNTSWAANVATGALELNELSDVNTSTPTNRNVLVADGVDFESRALVEADISDMGTYSLSTHVHEGTEIDATAVTDGFVLTADGAGNSAWEVLPTPGALELSDLTDVNTSTPTNRNVLVADGVDFESRALVEADISDLGTYIPTSEKAVALGVATLGADGKVPNAQIPPLAITSTYVVANEIAQLALTVQEGDVAVRSDENKSYIALNDVNATMGDWQLLLTPTDAVLSVDGRTGVVTLGDLYATFAQGALADTALQAETNDLTAVVTWANVPDANITQTSVTQHEAALSITESQISNLQAYLTNINSEVIGDLSDVILTGSPALAVDDVLVYDGANWVHAQQTGTGGGASSLNGLTDVTVLTPAVGDILQYAGSPAGEFINQPLSVTNTNVDSETILDGYVLTATGAGETVWGAPPTTAGIYVAPARLSHSLPISAATFWRTIGSGVGKILYKVDPSNAPLDIDSVTPAFEDRVLFREAGANGGVYNFTSITGPTVATLEQFGFLLSDPPYHGNWDNTAGTYMWFSSPTTKYYVWFKRDGVGTDPAPAGMTNLGFYDSSSVFTPDNYRCQAMFVIAALIETGPFIVEYINDSCAGSPPSTNGGQSFVIKNTVGGAALDHDAGYSNSPLPFFKTSTTSVWGWDGGNWEHNFTRATDHDTGNEVIPGHTVGIEEGTNDAAKTFFLNTFTDIIVDSTSLNYIEVNAGLVVDGGGA